MKVTPIELPTDITSETLKQYLADCSSVVRNAQPKDNERLFQRLLKESFGDKPSRVFEYIPCKLSDAEFMYGSKQANQFFGFWDGEFYYTNARELLNWGTEWESIVDHVDFTHYRTVKVTAPYFLYGQASTHNQITSVSHSNRYTESGLGYWMPDESNQLHSQEEWDKMIPTVSPEKLQNYMKHYGVKRREVYARGSDMLAYRVFTLGGYLNNPNAWPQFINQRLHDPHTQLEMRSLTSLIYEALASDHKYPCEGSLNTLQ